MHICVLAIVFALALSLSNASPILASDTGCGHPDAPCAVEDGEYYAALPEAVENPPAVLWLHGFARSGKAMIQKSAYVDPFLQRGFAVIMPSGQPFPGKKELDWGVSDGHSWERDDIAFLKAVLGDAAQRFNLDQTRILVAGFSRGGSMVWDVACQAPGLAKGFAAVAGAFWEPMPDDCLQPTHLFHTHGFKDRMVPFEGRDLIWGGLEFEQGNVMKGVDIWRRQNGCMDSAKNSFGDDGSMQKDWAECADGSIRLKLTKGGHGIPKLWRDAVLDWFDALP